MLALQLTGLWELSHHHGVGSLSFQEIPTATARCMFNSHMFQREQNQL